MYIPKQFSVQDPKVLADFMRRHSFAILFSQTEQGAFATHLPFWYDEEHHRLLAHMAKANPHWKSLDGQEVLVVFQGPHAYISPNYYGEAKTVPTWNYAAVHAYGELKLLHEPEQVAQILNNLTDTYESGFAAPWEPAYGEPWFDAELNHIVGFEIKLSRLEGKWKLNQHHPIARTERVVEALRDSNDQDEQNVAELMAEVVKNKRAQEPSA